MASVIIISVPYTCEELKVFLHDSDPNKPAEDSDLRTRGTKDVLENLTNGGLNVLENP